MAWGRKFWFVDPSGNTVDLSDRSNGVYVLNGVTGLGMSTYDVETSKRPDFEGLNIDYVNSTDREIFLPLNVEAPDRASFLAFKQNLAYRLSPRRGFGYLYIQDGMNKNDPTSTGITVRIPVVYKSGLEGDETVGNAGVDAGWDWVRTSIVFTALQPYFEYSQVSIIGPYAEAEATSFFNILPVRLGGDVVLSDYSALPQTNWITNPSFELGNITGWSVNWFSAPHVIANAVNTFAKFGNYSCKVDFPGGGAPGTTPQFWNGTAIGALTAGETYTASLWVYVPSGNPRARLLTWNGNSSFTTTNDQWELLTVTFTCTVTTPMLAIGLEPLADGSGPAGTIYVDGAQMVNGTYQGYVDGDQPGCGWNGTPHASTSYRSPQLAPTVVTNLGTAPSRAVFLATGPGSFLDLWNRTTDEHVTMQGYTIAPNETVEIDMQNRTIKSLATGDSLWEYLTAKDFWALQAGDNLCTFQMNDATLGSQISGTYRPQLEALV